MLELLKQLERLQETGFLQVWAANNENSSVHQDL